MNEKLRAFIEKHIKEQIEYDLDELIEELKLKWNDDKYYYDEDEARKFYKFITKLELDKGQKGQKIKPLKFQFEIITEILCIKNIETNFRRFRESLLDIGRKNGKGSLTAWIMTYLYFTDYTFGAEYIIVANDKTQAGNLFNTINLMITNNKTLKKYVKITDSRKFMYRKATNSYLRVLSNDGGGLDSYAAYCVVLDEIHEYKDAKAYEKLRTGMGLWDDPLLFMTTTASSGEDPANLEMEMYTYSKCLENGEFTDEAFYYKIYEADKNCKMDDIEQQVKANPALGMFRKLKDLQDFAKKAMKLKTRENAFRRLYLNQHVTTDIENAINMDLWDSCVKDIDLEDLSGLKYCGGLDMSLCQDITAYLRTFYDDERDKYIVYPRMYTPLDTLEERSERDNIRYDTYVKKGELIALEGKSINVNHMVEDVEEIDLEYNFKNLEIAYDRWGAKDVRAKLEDKYDVAEMGQGFKTMSPVIKDFENLLLEERLIIADNSFLRFMAKNVVAVSDDAVNIKYSKKRSKFKIDGIIALVMSLSRAIFNTNELINTNKYTSEEYLNRLYGGGKDEN
ncbi:terminase large subunit [Tepidibacter mesophilus]|uniref:terminase large subunit n=1 Tax=Tepidibacter mesophilus TaxID=655607 RepID=UPI000C080FCB|nr:terminase TerL endonuclease subunit [Tepidibacter mesophilus]